MNRAAKAIITMITAVPRLGWSKMSPDMRLHTTSTGRIVVRVLRSLPALSASHAAAKRAMANLASSEGWKLIGPK